MKTTPEDTMPAWISLLMSGLVGVLAAGISVGLMKGSLRSISEGQERLQKSVDSLTDVTATLSTKVTVNSYQHDELSRRLAYVETKIGEHTEVLRMLRTRTHVLANKIQEIDPDWRPYTEPKE